MCTRSSYRSAAHCQARSKRAGDVEIVWLRWLQLSFATISRSWRHVSSTQTTTEATKYWSKLYEGSGNTIDSPDRVKPPRTIARASMFALAQYGHFKAQDRRCYKRYLKAILYGVRHWRPHVDRRDARMYAHWNIMNKTRCQVVRYRLKSNVSRQCSDSGGALL